MRHKPAQMSRFQITRQHPVSHPERFLSSALSRIARQCSLRPTCHRLSRASFATIRIRMVLAQDGISNFESGLQSAGESRGNQ